MDRRCFTHDDVCTLGDLVEVAMMFEAGVRPGVGQEGDSSWILYRVTGSVLEIADESLVLVAREVVESLAPTT